MDPEELRAAAPSYVEPQLEPSDHAYTILQDHGPNNGGWGPAAVLFPWESRPIMFVYTGDAPHVLDVLQRACRNAAQDTGKPTRLVRYERRVDVFSVGGAS
jgi:hypothetical protein